MAEPSFSSPLAKSSQTCPDRVESLGPTEIDNSGISVRVVRNLEGIEEIRDVWSSWNRRPNSDIDFYLTVLQHGSQIMRPHVFVLYRGGSPDALLIGRIQDTRLELKIGYRTALRPRVRMLTFINAGFLGNQCSANSKILTEAVRGTLQSGEADVVFFNLLRSDSPLFSCLLLYPGWLSRDHFPSFQPHRGLVLPASKEDFFRGLSPKARKNQKWQAKRLLNDYSGNVRIECFQTTDQLDQAFRDIEHVARKTYQRGLGAGFMDDAFMRQRLLLEAQKGWLRAYVLYVTDRPCAFWVGTLYHETFHSDFMGYDPAYAKHSPGMFLILKVIEEFCSPNPRVHVREIDFGFGDAQYKEVLGNHNWEEASIYVFAPNLKGICLNALRTSVVLTDQALRKALDRTELLQRVKKIWRGRARQK
jgi:hypothetical protein